jgi:hypothetical protein
MQHRLFHPLRTALTTAAVLALTSTTKVTRTPMNDASRSSVRPALRDWYLEGLVFLLSAAATGVAVALAVGAVVRRTPVLDLGVVTVGVVCGLVAASRFRARRLANGRSDARRGPPPGR